MHTHLRTLIRLIATAASAAVFLALAAGAAAVVVAPTNFPLPGNTFQGGDGNQANPTAPADPSNPPPFPATVDWESLAASPTLAVIDDPDVNDSIYDTGSKESAPLNWDVDVLATGSTPAKSNAFTSWVSLESGNFLHFAFDRETSGGNVFYAFELNQDGRAWKNASGDLVQCRKTDDLIVSYSIQNNANINVLIQRWVSDTVVSADEAAVYTNGVGCAKTGGFQNFDVPLTLVRAAMNQGVSITNYLPHAPAVGTLGTELFGEASLNLPGILRGVLGKPCLSFVQVNLHGRSSEANAASLQDLVGPIPFVIRNCALSGVVWHDVDADGVREDGEPLISGWKVYLDEDGDDQLDAGEPTAVTNAAGEYLFENVADGTHAVRQAPAAEQSAANQGFRCSFPSAVDADCEQAAVLSAQSPSVGGLDFGNVKPAPPTAARVRSLTAKSGARGVVVRWRTASEAGALGFNLFRDSGDRRVRVNRSLIAARGAMTGTSYSFVDVAGKRGHRYLLQEVRADGKRTWRGSVRVSPTR